MYQDANFPALTCKFWMQQIKNIISLKAFFQNSNVYAAGDQDFEYKVFPIH